MVLNVLLLNKNLLEQLREVFLQKGFELTLLERAHCDSDAISMAKPDIILFDVGMHSEDDFLLYLDIVRWSNVPVLPVIYRKENSHYTMLTSQELLKDVEAILLGTDYSDQKENLASVKQYPYALTHYHDIFETIPYAVFLHDIHTGAVRDVNLAATKLFGYSRDELMNENPSIAYPPDTAFTMAHAMKHIDTAVIHGAHAFEWSACRKTGELMWLKVHLSLVAISDETLIMAVVHDITRERQLQKALEASEKRFKAVFEEFSDGLMLVDENGIVDCNAAVEQMFGYSKEEIIGLHPADLSPQIQPDGQDSRMLANEKIIHAMQRNVQPFRWVHRHKNGQDFWTEVALIVITIGDRNFILSIIKDITEIVKYENDREQFQKHMLQFQKMEAIATLAGGIAHDFNNMLTSIIGNINLAIIYLEKKDYDSTQSFKQSLDAALFSASQASELVKKLLSISRKTAGNVENVVVQDVLHDVKKICSASFPKTITVTYSIPPDAIYVAVDRVLLTQAVINCCINASHAVTLMRKEGNPGGTVTVGCSKGKCPDHIAAVHPEAKPSVEYAIISITDDGVGMDQETQQHIFEPFFSTKDKSIGTGLGLSMVYSSIINAGGFVHVDSSLGKGTTISLYLPALQC